MLYELIKKTMSYFAKALEGIGFFMLVGMAITLVGAWIFDDSRADEQMEVKTDA